MRVPIVLTCDETYFAGLYVVVGGVLLHAREDTEFCFHVVDGGIREESWGKLSALVARLSPRSRLNRIPCDDSTFHGLPRDAGDSYMCYIRLLMPELIDESKILFLDSDLVILRPVEPLFATELGDTLLGGIRDAGQVYLRNDCPIFQSTGAPGDTPYFNAGILVVDLDAWRKEGVQKKTIDYLAEYGQVSTWRDQTALNTLYWNRATYLSDSWNTQSYRFPDDIGFETHILHFVGPAKPFREYVPGYVGAAWYAQADALGLPFEDSFRGTRRRRLFTVLRTLDRLGVLGPIYRAISRTWSQERRKFFPYPLWRNDYESLLDRYRQHWRTRGTFRGPDLQSGRENVEHAERTV